MTNWWSGGSLTQHRIHYSAETLQVKMTSQTQQHLHVNNPDTLLGKGDVEGSGNKLTILGKRFFTDDPDNIDTKTLEIFDNYENFGKTFNKYDGTGKTFL